MTYAVCERGHLRCQGKKLVERFSFLNVSIIPVEVSFKGSLKLLDGVDKDSNI